MANPLLEIKGSLALLQSARRDGNHKWKKSGNLLIQLKIHWLPGTVRYLL